MRLVTQALEKEEDRITRVECEAAAVGQVEGFAPGMTIGALGDPEHGNVRQAQLGERRGDR